MNCPLCGDSSHREIGINIDFAPARIVACAACRFMWTVPMPSETELSERYRREYRELRQEQVTTSFLAARDLRARAQREFILAHKEGWRTRTDLDVMDVGCAAGSLLSAFTPNARSITGYEPDEQMAAKAHDRLPSGAIIHNRLFDASRPSDRTYDLITMSHVLEHARDPVAALRRLFRLCKAGGIVFLEVPNESLTAVAKTYTQRRRGLFHLVFFHCRTLERCVERAGGTVLNIATFGDDLHTPSFFAPGGMRRLGNGISGAVLRGRRFESARLRRVMFYRNPRQGKWLRCLCAPGEN